MEVAVPVSILVPLDGSHFAERALPVAAALSRRAGAPLHIVQVHEFLLPQMGPDGVFLPHDDWDRRMRSERAAYLEKTAGSLRSADLRVEAELLDGSVVDALTDYVTQKGIGLVVMTTHARGGIGRAWLGSVATKLIQRGGAPILVWRPQEAEGAEAAWLAQRHNIVVPLDGTDIAAQILPHAEDLARLLDASFTLVRVVTPLSVIVPPHAEALLVAHENVSLEEQLDRAGQELEGVAAVLRGKGFEVRNAVLTANAPGPELVVFAERSGATVVALATHGRGALGRLAWGSVADKLIRGATCPVLVHKPTG
jgi:nucleotide-binding universal stress UspA family protein